MTFSDLLNGTHFLIPMRAMLFVGEVQERVLAGMISTTSQALGVIRVRLPVHINHHPLPSSDQEKRTVGSHDLQPDDCLFHPGTTPPGRQAQLPPTPPATGEQHGRYN